MSGIVIYPGMYVVKDEDGCIYAWCTSEDAANSVCEALTTDVNTFTKELKVDAALFCSGL